MERHWRREEARGEKELVVLRPWIGIVGDWSCEDRCETLEREGI